ncbi:homocitrate synthase [Natronospora cellulosivora (SeqCode)]
MSDFYIIDSTLRDGEQTAGVAFSRTDKIRIALMLDQLGIDIIEVGIPAMGEEEISTISEIIAMDLQAEILTWNRMVLADIDKSLETGGSSVHISAPVSDIHIQHKLKKSREWVLKNIEEVVRYAVDNNCIVSVGAEDASRADQGFLLEFYKTALNAGAIRLRYADTVGFMEPLLVHQTISTIRKEIKAEIDYHGHNDFGMATANALAAYKAGAKYISCTINGLGERAGNTALEEIVMALKYIEKSNTKIQVDKLMHLSREVEKLSGRLLSESKPIVGKKVFSHESGIHVDGLLKDSRTYEAFSPEDIGRKRDFVLGKFSGSSAVLHKYREEGREISREEAKLILIGLRKSCN